MNKLSKIKYTIDHRKTFREVEKELLGKNTLRGLLHDIDKLLLYLIFDVKKASTIHRKYSKHHERATSKNDYIQMVIDWESARFTKPDKPLDARDTLYKLYPELKEEVLPILNELGL